MKTNSIYPWTAVKRHTLKAYCIRTEDWCSKVRYKHDWYQYRTFSDGLHYWCPNCGAKKWLNSEAVT